MPKHKLKKCPQCSCSVNSSVSRLIRDACGHKKCRLCLVREEKGCLACEAKENSESQESNNENPDSPDNLAVNSDESSNVITTDNNPPEANIGEPPKEFREDVSSQKVSVVSKTVKNKKLTLQSHIIVLPGTPQKYRCTICNKECSTKYTVQYHNYCGSENKRYKCEMCDKGFVTKSHYDYHMNSHKGILPYVCSVCGKGFKQKGKLQRHSTRHSDNRPFVCQECGKTFGYYESLKSHQRVHKGEKPHVCQLCSRSFTEFSNYKKHVTIVHKGEKAHMCDTCGKTFAVRRTLILHISMVHHHDRNYSCNICNKPFNLKKDLKRHEVVHSVVQPHSCTLCGQGFRRKDNFERHMKNTHPETRMVIVGTFKQKSSTNKAATGNNQKNKDNNENEEILEKNIPSPIPPSQTVDPETLRSITKISDDKKNMNKAREDKFSEQNRETNSSNYMETDLQINYSAANPNASLIQESLPDEFREQCYKNIDTIQKTPGDSATPYIPQESNPVATSIVPTIYPPKKNVEYYREVSVINRSSNVIGNCISESIGQNITTNYQQQTVRRVEGTNCVPTITRASEYVSGSVITRNLQQSSSSVVKPSSSHSSYQAMDSVPASETQVNQPSLRKLLNDVKCSDGSDILNLTSDVNLNKRSLFTDNFRHLDDLKFYKHNDVEQFYSSKYPDIYVPETSLQNTGDEHTSISHEKYLSNNFNQKDPSDTLISHNNCKQNNSQSLNYSFIPPPCAEYRDNSGENLSQYSEVLQPSEMENRNLHALNKTYSENYGYGTKHFDSDSRLKLISGISHTEDASCAQAVGQPVIVGTNKISNNVICTNMSS